MNKELSECTSEEEIAEKVETRLSGEKLDDAVAISAGWQPRVTKRRSTRHSRISTNEY